MKTTLSATMVINIIAAIVLSVILTGMEVANLCGCDLPCISGDGDDERKRIILIRMCL